MKLIPREYMKGKVVSSLGMGLLALSLSGSALADAEKGKSASAGKPASAAKTPAAAKKTKKGEAKQAGKPEIPAHARAKVAAAKAKGAEGKPEAAKAAHELERKRKGPSRKDREAKGAARVQQRAAFKRYLAAKAAAKEAEKALENDDESVDKVEALAARKAALDEIKRARKGLHSAHRYNANKQFRKLKKAERRALQGKMKEYQSELKKDRKDRAEKGREALGKRYGKKLGLKTMKAELGAHGWRVARLNQLIKIAEVSERPEAAERAKKLLDKENSAHKKKLAKLSLAPLPKPKPAAKKVATPKKAKALPVKKPSAPAAKGAAQ